jgi:hypothetical protein
MSELKLADVPTTLAPELWEHRLDADALSDPIVQGLRVAHQSARSAWVASLTAHRKIMEDQYATPVMNAKRSAVQADRRQAEACRALDAAKARADREVELMEESITASLKEAATGHGGEIRAHLKSLPSEQRTAFLTGRLRAGDYGAVSAALSAPSYLSGMTDSEWSMMHAIYRQNRFPQAVARYEGQKSGQA